jgi:RimK family alpha-L-glutamate ligase
MMKKIWFIYPGTTPRQSNAFGWFRESFLRYGMEVEFFFWDESMQIPGIEILPLPDAVIVRGYNLPLSAWFESYGVRVLNSTLSMELCRDKIATAEVLVRMGIPTPATKVYPEKYPSWNVLRRDFASEEVVMKLSMGSKGEEVFLVGDEAGYRSAIDRCEASAILMPGSMPLFQEFVSTSYGKDLRVWVIGGRVVGHTLRSNKSSFKSNFAQGGDALKVELPEVVEKLAIKATDALGLDFAGVDLLFGGGKWPDFMVCEVNGNAGFRTASLVGGIDIPSALACYVANFF